MQEIINCPSCRRKLQVPDSLLGQDVQCPTCGATFVAAWGNQTPDSPVPRSEQHPWQPPSNENPNRAEHYADEQVEGDEYEDYPHRPRRYRRRRDYEPHRGSTILTLGILSLFMCGPILGPIAWVMGNQDLSEIKAGRMDPEGESSTNAGKICGMVATLLSILGLLIGCLWIAGMSVILIRR